MSATITGARPGTVCRLTGNGCSAAVPTPDHIWAAGVTDSSGTAELTGHAWTGAVADVCWLAVSPPPVSPGPGLLGTFPLGMASQFPAGQAPCGQP